MDWSYVAMAAEQGAPGIAAILVPLPILVLSSLQGRKLVACSPGIVVAATFAISCVVSGLTTWESPAYLDYLPSVGSLLTAILVVPSIRALRRRWVGLVHVLTLIGALFVWFVGSMAIAHDWL